MYVDGWLCLWVLETKIKGVKLSTSAWTSKNFVSFLTSGKNAIMSTQRRLIQPFRLHCNVYYVSPPNILFRLYTNVRAASHQVEWWSSAMKSPYISGVLTIIRNCCVVEFYKHFNFFWCPGLLFIHCLLPKLLTSLYFILVRQSIVTLIIHKKLLMKAKRLHAIIFDDA